MGDRSREAEVLTAPTEQDMPLVDLGHDTSAAGKTKFVLVSANNSTAVVTRSAVSASERYVAANDGH